MTFSRWLPGALVALFLVGCASSSERDTSAPVSMSTATILTIERRPSQCISPISVYQVDDRNFVTPIQKFEVEPGVHEIRGRALISNEFCQPLALGSTGGANLEPLRHEFEAGKIYKIGVNHRANRASGWFLEVWEVVDK